MSYIHARNMQAAPIQEQWLRMLRWYERVKKIIKNSQSHPYEDFMDFLLVYFNQCFCMRDWIIEAGVLSQESVNEFFNSSESLKVCRDVTNGFKHLKINKPSIDGNFMICSEYDPEFGISFSNKNYNEVVILAAYKKYSVLELIENCKNELQEFIQRNSIMDEINELLPPLSPLLPENK